MSFDNDIIQLGHSTLRKRATSIDDVTSSETHRLTTLLYQNMMASDGVGIAAPQVDISIRLFLMSSRPNKRYPEAPVMPLTIVINPKILWYSVDMEKDWEGCLSVPDVRGLVPRHNTIKVEYTDAYGHTIKAKYSGFIARIFQHEYDHLQGTLFIDRVSSDSDLLSEQEWQSRFITN